MAMVLDTLLRRTPLYRLKEFLQFAAARNGLKLRAKDQA